MSPHGFGFNHGGIHIPLAGHKTGLFNSRGDDRRRLCVIANREPYIHESRDGSIEVLTPASGLVTALEPIVRSNHGLWIGHGSGTADRLVVDRRDVVSVPPGNPQYELKRVWLTEEEERGYYYGFSNEGLWPLCHIVHTRPIFRRSDWETYQTVNMKFAKAFNVEVEDESPIVLIQDYHFGVLPKMVRKLKPEAAISLFWHIPWSGPDVMRICPWKEALVAGMLGADLIGFQTQYHCNNFLDCVDRFLEARVDREKFSVTQEGHTCYVRPFPVSIETPSPYEKPARERHRLRELLLASLQLPPETKLGLGVDRVDYTKGLLERFEAIEMLFDKHPELLGKFVFVQIGAPSRGQIPRYRAFLEDVVAKVKAVNQKFQRQVIQLRLRHHDASEIFPFYRAADVCIVNSLHDGMNLVAKEYVGARNDGNGALVLSSFTGAAREFEEAFIVNPYDIEGTANAIHEGLTAPAADLRIRMARMRTTLSSWSAHHWGNALLGQLQHLTERRAVA